MAGSCEHCNEPLAFKKLLKQGLCSSGTKIKGKTIPVTGRRSPQGRETSRLSHFLEKWLTDGSDVFSLMRRPAVLYPQEDSWY
jgi:hypothetical protein